ncbi:MAG: PrsW family intramembrane metalloprotease [Candidatus Bipolaricaulota bacterium]|nr:PrsW family intramembrane metalloprotease [Candidatus Bipolaricaulota bacterium]
MKRGGTGSGRPTERLGDMGARIALTVICTILPFFVLLRYYYTRDVFREPRAALVRTFLLGLVITIPAVLVELGLGAVPLRTFSPVTAALYVAFVVAAIPEESLKLLVIGRYCARLRDFDEPMDGIVYGATAALGFAALENVLYVADGGLLAAIVRSLTSVPMHATCGAILGYYVARGRFGGGGRADPWKGWALAVLLHGAYDFGPFVLVFLEVSEPDLRGMGMAIAGVVLLLICLVVISWLAIRRLIFRLREAQLLAGPRDERTVGRGLPDLDAPLAAHLHSLPLGPASGPAPTPSGDAAPAIPTEPADTDTPRMDGPHDSGGAPT